MKAIMAPWQTGRASPSMVSLSCLGASVTGPSRRRSLSDSSKRTPFLQRHDRRIDFGKSAILMGDKELACVDKFGRPLMGEEPIVRTCTMPGHSKGTVRHQVDGGHTSRTGVVESTHLSVPAARSSNQLTRKGKTSCHASTPPRRR